MDRNDQIVDRIRRMRERFDELRGRIAEAFADAPADKGVAEIDAAVARVRRLNSRFDGAHVAADSRK
jgi:hypothetical protein